MREDKPPFAAIPPAMIARIEALAQSPVTDGDIVYGGYSVAANFRLDLADGRRLFAKGSHPGDDSHGIQNLRQDIFVYEHMDVVRALSPRYHGVVSDGDEDGWALGLWDWVDIHPDPPDLSALRAALRTWQAAPPEGLKPAAEQNYIRDFFTPGKKWLRLAHEPLVREGFLSLIPDPGWLDRNLPALCALQAEVAALDAPVGCLHGDLRADNVFQDRKGRVFIVDWPNACAGPLVFDALFLGASRESLHRGRVEDLLSPATPPRAAHVMAAAIAGQLATFAGRPVPARLPRLRGMQAGLLRALLGFLARAGAIQGL